uniref:Neur_chan_memb domain-containing protein n=1 Tax=Globodera pallida TaxID=36090 RepID=A0A183BU21_GLOPA
MESIAHTGKPAKSFTKITWSKIIAYLPFLLFALSFSLGVIEGSGSEAPFRTDTDMTVISEDMRAYLYI